MSKENNPTQSTEFTTDTTNTATVITPVNSIEQVKKIKIQKRTPTERQLEALEKARLSKQKNKMRNEITKEMSGNSNSFLLPSPYLVGTILLGLGGLVAYSYLKPETNSEIIPEKSTQEPTPTPTPSPKPPTVPIQMTEIPQPIIPPASPRTQAFFSGSMKI